MEASVSFGEGIVSFIPLIVLSIPFAIGNWFVADRLGRNRIAWVILTLVPLVNIVFFYYVLYVVILGVLDRLNAISDRLERTAAQPR